MIDLKPNPTLADLQAYVEKICIQRGWDKRTVNEKMLFLTEEVGEVAKEVRKLQSIAAHKPETTQELGDEIIDVMNYLFDIATEFGIDLEEAFRRKWTRTATRVWPGGTPQK